MQRGLGLCQSVLRLLGPPPAAQGTRQHGDSGSPGPAVRWALDLAPLLPQGCPSACAWSSWARRPAVLWISVWTSAFTSLSACVSPCLKRGSNQPPLQKNIERSA